MDDRDNERVRIGIVGCAEIARKLCRVIALTPNAVLQAVGSRSLDKAKFFAAENGLSSTGVRLYGSYKEIVEDPSVDAVYLPLPTSLHVQWAVAAARHKKHVLLEKPVALDTTQLDQILEACSSNGVQFMDGTMWLHHPRTLSMRKLISNPQLFGYLDYVYSSSTFCAPPEFLESNIRVKPDLDSLGALGDLGWYSIGSILWAVGYELPVSVMALPQVTCNSAGVILACSASLFWDRSPGCQEPTEPASATRRTVATFHCSFMAHMSMDLTIIGSNGSIHVKDLAIPFEENSASYEFTPLAKFVDLHIGWSAKPERTGILSEIPQEALMVQEFASLVRDIKRKGLPPESKWPEISRKTQLVLDAVKKSIDLGYSPVYL
ncbi:hypothetical protein SAY87_018851 [Trapa incisa]|uniref:Gfo/Idh/MocA-like oxidoreductase N-terminal domain-containing protein n=1 Tax=Trapa incisa TaxID=236973 RepID=A0AAN7Q692_9MYRT|nr:hypothetical protein SAY87_018851 [Trapa incisa]